MQTVDKARVITECIAQLIEVGFKGVISDKEKERKLMKWRNTRFC